MGSDLAGLDAALTRFATASPTMLADRRLLRRVDTKFLLPAESLVWILASVSRDYQVLRPGGRALATYETTYFDTADLRCFHDHRRDRRPRHKIRVRNYPDRDVAFFEIKTKRANGETNKHRLELASFDREIGGAARRLVDLHTSLPSSELAPSLDVNFSRITLLSIRDHERATIDVGLHFGDGSLGGSLGDVAIVEVKQPTLSRQSPILGALHNHGYYPQSGSKYCTTLVMARPSIPQNHVRSTLRALERFQR